MNDPFAMLDPMAKPKAPVGGGNAANYATTPMNFGQQPGIGYQQQQQPNANPFGGMSATGNPMMMNNNNHSSMHQQQMYPPQHNGAAFMTQPGPPSFSGLPPAPTQQMGVNTTHTNNPFMQPPSAPFQIQQANPFGASQPVMFAAQQDPFGTQMKPSPGGFAHPQLRPAEPTSHHHPTTMPAPLTHSSSIVMDFDPYSPRDNTPRSPFDLPVDHSGSSSSSSASASASALADRKRQTQEAQRSQLGFTSDAFATGSNPKISLKELATTTNSSSNNGGGNGTRVQSGSNAFGDAPFFTESNDDFMDQNMFANLDDDTPGQTKKDWNHFAQKRDRSDDDDSGGDIPRECGPHEYDVTFETGRKLGVLMERVDVWGAKRDDKRQEIAVVKLVVENGAADRVGVTTGSSVVAINGRSVAKDTYAIVLDMIKAAPRPMSIRFKRGTVNKDTTQGNVLTRISNGTFSVGNLTRGNASWTDKYSAFGGAKMDVLQLFVSRAAYHECVISLYEKRPVHTQIQSFRLCRDHKISPIKSKIYKGYGNLHYFSLTVPSLRFVAAKFASEDYETLKNLWSHTYDAIERKKRMGY